MRERLHRPIRQEEPAIRSENDNAMQANETESTQSDLNSSNDYSLLDAFPNGVFGDRNKVDNIFTQLRGHTINPDDFPNGMLGGNNVDTPKQEEDLAENKNTHHQEVAQNKDALLSSTIPPHNLKVQKHTIQQGETLTSIAKKYGVSVQSLAKWNNIADINKIIAGDSLIVSDPNRPTDWAKFTVYPTVKESSGWLFGAEGTQSISVTSGIELASASILNYDVVYLKGNLLDQIKKDPDMLAKENILINKLKNDLRFGKESFYYTNQFGVEFGGKRWSAPNEEWSSTDANNPLLHKETLNVATNELTWVLRHATVKYWAEVSADGSITIQYRLWDRLDLSGSKGRSEAYNTISDVLGFMYHDMAGGNINLQTRAEWSVSK